MKDLADITALQSRILDILWDSGAATTAQLVEALGADEYARTTVATLLKRMHRYGWLSRTEGGRSMLYEPAVSRSAVRRAHVQQLIRSFFRDELPSLMSHALEEGDWTEEDLEEIERLLRIRREGRSG